MTAAAAVRLFVYGTLREGAGHPMHAVLASSGACVGAASVAGRLVRVDWYPGLVVTSAGEASRVIGEVWALRDDSAFAALDDYEADEYERRILPVRLATGETLEAWTYVFTAAANDLEPIESGDWLHQAR